MSAARRDVIVAVAAVVSLALWPVQIDRAFGLPAHPLIIHVPVIFIPVLGLAALALMFRFDWFERYGVLLAAFSVVSLAATLLAVGAGEAFKEDVERFFPPGDPTLHDHEDAGITVRLAMVVLTALLVGLLWARRVPNAVGIVLRVLAVLFALTALAMVIRTAHLGATLAWGEREGGAPPGGNYGTLPDADGG
jgi:hypothetical protein